MRLQFWDFTTDDPHPRPSLFIKPFSDLHIGHPRHNPVVTQREVDWLLGAPNRMTFLDGDMTETALRDSYGEIYDQPLSPQKQADEVVHVFDRVRSRILGCVSGNHEQRVRLRTSFDPAMIYASALGVPYDPASMVLCIRIGSRKRNPPYYIIYFTHGWGAARSMGARITLADKLADVVLNADVYVTAHTHQPDSHPVDGFWVDTSKRNITRKTQRMVSLGSALDHAEYAEATGRPPTSMEFPIIELVDPSGSSNNEKRVIIHSS